MNKIEEYINSIYGNFDNLDTDTKILKEEMKSHLFEEVEELKKQGFSDEESISMTLERFGHVDAVVAEISHVLKNRNILTKLLIKAGVIVFIIGCLLQVIGLFYNNETFRYFSGVLSKNGFKNISYLFFIISLAIWNIAFYYYYFIKERGLVLIVFLVCDFVICTPILIVWLYFPNHIIESLAFIFGITFLITFLIRIYYIKFKKIL